MYAAFLLLVAEHLLQAAGALQPPLPSLMFVDVMYLSTDQVIMIFYQVPMKLRLTDSTCVCAECREQALLILTHMT